MTVAITKTIHHNFIRLTAIGTISNIEEYQDFVVECVDEIQLSPMGRVIIDESKVEFPSSVMIHIEIINFMDKSMPADMKNWTLACVGKGKFSEILKMRAYMSNKAGFTGFRAFDSMREHGYMSLPDLKKNFS